MYEFIFVKKNTEKIKNPRERPKQQICKMLLARFG